MYLSTSEAVFGMIAIGASMVLTTLILMANNILINKNRYLREALRNKNKYCAQHHTEVPF